TVYANPKFADMLGYTLEEMIGKESYIFWDPESAKRVRHVNMSDRKKGISSSYEGMLLTKNKEKIPVLLSGTPLPDGGTIGIMTDLRELKKRQEAEKLLTRAIEYANDAIVVTDVDGNIDLWNRGARLMFAYRQREIVGKSLTVLFPSNH